MSEMIDLLQHRQWLWHGREQGQSFERISSGIKMLDNKLQGGLPRQGVVEVLSPQGIGELQLFQSYLVQQNKLLVFICPPGVPNVSQFYHLGLDCEQLLLIKTNTTKDALWAAEQCLNSHACDSVLLWCSAMTIAQAKRLQLAAHKGRATLFLFREQSEVHFSLPVELSLLLSAHSSGIKVHIKKQKGGRAQVPFVLSLQEYWPQLYTVVQTTKKPTNVITLPTAIGYGQ